MNNKLRITIGLLSFVLLIGIISCNSQKEHKMKLEWSKLSTRGLNDNLAKGVSASYSALINGNIIVAGGANFPDKLGFEGGSKAFYDEIMIYNQAEESWKQIGTLPKKSAYGVSVVVRDGAYWIGGNTDSESLSDVYLITLNDDETINMDSVTSLPTTMDNFAGCEINNKLFVAGGVVDGKPSNSMFMLDIEAGTDWQKLPDYPGIARVQPVMSALNIDGNEYIYLLGGFFGGDAHNDPSMLIDVLRYDVAAQQWEVVGSKIDNERPFSLGGATAMSYDNRYIVCFGGVNHDVFLDAITTQYNIGNDESLTPEEKKDKNLEFSKHYMTQPIEYYNFNKECRVFDAYDASWKTIEVAEDFARAGATLVFNYDMFYLVQGELKPGVRSPLTFKGKIGYK